MTRNPLLPHTWRDFVAKIILAAGFITLAAVSALAGSLDLGSPTSHTPYDQYLGPMWEVLHRLGGANPDMNAVDHLVAEGRAFRYSFNKEQPYCPQTPEVTESTKSGDCKAKALWLAAKLDTRNVRFVIGKASAERTMNHAWLIWEGPQGWLILDATMYSRPLQPERLLPTDYVATYSYSPTGRYAHAVVTSAGSKYGDHL
ncbi:MAG TPA: hypothetical protein VGM54_10430 [Chthoniobacter sp.]|jgi:hypothetical protein